MLYLVHLAWVGFELTTLVVIGSDCIGSCQSNYHMMTTTTVTLISLVLFDWRLSTRYSTLETSLISTDLIFSLFIWHAIHISTCTCTYRYFTKTHVYIILKHIQSNLPYVTFSGNREIWSHKAGGRFNTGLIDIKCTVRGNKN
jgi:hypothetical protein